jgi:hypothetical protein
MRYIHKLGLPAMYGMPGILQWVRLGVWWCILWEARLFVAAPRRVWATTPTHHGSYFSHTAQTIEPKLNKNDIDTL